MKQLISLSMSFDRGFYEADHRNRVYVYFLFVILLSQCTFSTRENAMFLY